MKKLNITAIIFYTACFIVLIFGGIVLLSALGVELVQSQTARIEAQAELETVQAAADVLRWRQKEQERRERNTERERWFVILGLSVLLTWALWRMDRRITSHSKDLIEVIDWVVRREK